METLTGPDRARVLAIKLGTPLKTLADVIHPFPALIECLEKA